MKEHQNLKHLKNRFGQIQLGSLYLPVLLALITILFISNASMSEYPDRSVVRSQVFETKHLSCPFVRGLYEPTNRGKEKKEVKGLVIPHHLLARDMIINALDQVGNKPKTVILVGPNHKNYGDHNLQTSSGEWNTKFGSLYPDIELISQLQTKGLVYPNEGAVKIEHSVCGIVSFIKVFFPDSLVLPIIINSSTSDVEIIALSDYLSSNCLDCLIIASVDFSHEVDTQMAILQDEESSNVLVSLDQTKISDITSDSNLSLKFMVDYMIRSGIDEGRLLENSNSFEILAEHPENVTSYITITY